MGRFCRFFSFFAIAVVFWAGALIGLYYSAELLFTPSKPLGGYDISSSSALERSDAMPHQEEKETLSLQARLAKGDLSHGRRVFQRCAICHTAQPQGGNHVGPRLFGVFKRKIAALSTFSYSRAMRAFGKKQGYWTEELLDKYLQNPRRVVPGTAMAFAGIFNAQDRIDLILYLKSLGKTGEG